MLFLSQKNYSIYDCVSRGTSDSACVDLCVCVCVCVVTQSPWFVLPWPEATWVLVLGKKCMLLLQLVLWKEKKKNKCAQTVQIYPQSQFYFIYHKRYVSLLTCEHGVIIE